MEMLQIREKAGPFLATVAGILARSLNVVEPVLVTSYWEDCVTVPHLPD